MNQTNPYKDNPYKTKGYETTKNWLLPLIGLAEVIGTKGQSGGQYAMGLSDRIGQQTEAWDQKAQSWEEMQEKNREKALQRALDEKRQAQDEERLGWERQKQTTEQNFMNELAGLESLTDPQEKARKAYEIQVKYGKQSLPAPKEKKRYPKLDQKALEGIYDPVLKALAGSDDESAQEAFWSNWKPSERPKETNQNMVVGMDENGNPVYSNPKQLSETTIRGLSEIYQAPRILNDLRKAIEENGSVMGPVAGRFNTAMGAAGMTTPNALKAQKLNAKYEAVKQIVAKGMEGGVLRKEDMPKYEKILGSIKLQPAAAEQNLDDLQNLLSENFNAYVQGLQNSGRNVPFKSMPTAGGGEAGAGTQGYGSEEEARSAGHKNGDIVIINGVRGVLY